MFPELNHRAILIAYLVRVYLVKIHKTSAVSWWWLIHLSVITDVIQWRKVHHWSQFSSLDINNTDFMSSDRNASLLFDQLIIYSMHFHVDSRGRQVSYWLSPAPLSLLRRQCHFSFTWVNIEWWERSSDLTVFKCHLHNTMSWIYFFCLSGGVASSSPSLTSLSLWLKARCTYLHLYSSSLASWTHARAIQLNDLWRIDDITEEEKKKKRH